MNLAGAKAESTAVMPVILCGGSGTRLWPLSRTLVPKQLLPLVGEESLLQQTCHRAARAGAAAMPVVLCNEAQRFMVESQVRATGAEARVILEPVGRNTAPAVAIAALLAERELGPGTFLLVLPSDHVVRDIPAFAAAVGAGIQAARGGALVTFGIVPDRPETGYGYIRGGSGAGVRPVERFVEKPDLATARQFVESGQYFWNSGMFLFSAGDYLAELARHAPDILECCREALASGIAEGSAIRLGRGSFVACRSQSIDYAVMEKTTRAAVVPLEAGWSDVGSWASLHDVTPRDTAGNSMQGDVLAIDCRNSYLRSESRLVTAIGLDGCVVVETKDAVLVAPAGRAQDVRQIVDELASRKRSEATHGREVFRPWGSYDSLENGTGYQVKRLVVLPGAVLSLQLHHRRAEHWVVVTGIARITCGERVFDLSRNGYTFIPLGERHRIENPGTEVLQIIEVQVGDYLGEDDIVRIEDRYGRQGRTD